MFSFLKKKRDDAALAHQLASIVSLRAGTMQRMKVQDFINFARPWNIPPVYLHALFFIESTNSGFMADGRLTINVEPHVAYRNSKQGKNLYRQYPDLFYPSWRGMTSPVYRLSYEERWDHLIRAAYIDFNAGMCGCSYGAGQQLGEGWKELGFDSVTHLIEVLYEGQHTHLEVMLIFLKAKNQIENLRRGNLREVIRAYNGEDNVPEYMRRFDNALKQKRHLYA